MLNTVSLEWAPILARLSLVRAVDGGLASIEQDWGLKRRPV
ncbi:hypothetical protein [Vibrio jasicida]|nr:hypothetical protein [Vibrio jasicida]